MSSINTGAGSTMTNTGRGQGFAPGSGGSNWSKGILFVVIAIAVGFGVFFSNKQSNSASPQTEAAAKQMMTQFGVAQRLSMKGDAASIREAIDQIEAAVKQFESSVHAEDRPVARAMGEMVSYGMIIGREVAEIVAKIESVQSLIGSSTNKASLDKADAILKETIVAARSCLERTKATQGRVKALVDSIESDSAFARGFKAGASKESQFEAAVRSREIDVELIEQMQQIVTLLRQKLSASDVQSAKIDGQLNEIDAKITQLAVEQEALQQKMIDRMRKAGF